MRAVVCYPSWTQQYGLMSHFARRNSTWAPLNLVLIATCANKAGHQVSILDAEALRMKPTETAKELLRINPEVIGFTATSPFYHLSIEIAKMVKEGGYKGTVAVGGPHVTIMEEKIYESGPWDAIFTGESEEAFSNWLDKGAPHETVAAKPVFQGDYPLDRLPFPDRSLLSVKNYRLGTPRGRAQLFTSIQTMRGCPWACIFCKSEKLLTTRLLQRSPESVAEEVNQVVRDFGIRHFYIVDDVLTLYPERVMGICDELDRRGLDITFEGSTRANLVTDEMMQRMAKSGLVRLSFGLETIDSEMRKTMKKKVPLEHYTNANRLCNKYGVEAMNSVMIGLPGETRETVENTLNWIRDAKEVSQANFAIATPYPGTEFYEMAVAGDKGVVLQDQDFSNYLRYGSAVTTVGDLTPQDLLDLQNEGFIRIYSAPHRWPAMYRKHGIMGFVLTLYRIVKLITRKYLKKRREFDYPGVPA